MRNKSLIWILVYILWYQCGFCCCCFVFVLFLSLILIPFCIYRKTIKHSVFSWQTWFVSEEEKYECFKYIFTIFFIHFFNFPLYVLCLLRRSRFKRHASRFMLIFMKILKMSLKVLFSEITKRKQFTQNQWHLQPT
jgi:hypothetical protein